MQPTQKKKQEKTSFAWSVGRLVIYSYCIRKELGIRVDMDELLAPKY